MNVLQGLALLLCSTSCALLIPGPLAAQDYPARTVRIVVPFPPGGTPDVLGRLMAQKLQESWTQTVVVENRPGGNTIIGTEAVAKAAADGHTLLSMSSAHITTPLLVPTPYDAIADFAPVATLAVSDFMLVVHPSVPAGNLKELIAHAKSRPGQLNYASSGNAGAPHLAGEFMNILAGIKLTHVPYKGMGPAVTDLIGGQVQLAFAPAVNFLPHIRSGKLKAMAVSGSRMAVLPEVPTFAEAGLPGFEARAWYGLLAPRGTAPAITGKLSGEIGRILNLPDIREKLAGQGTSALISTPDQFLAIMKADAARMANVVRTAGIKLEQ
jgi:tripartite-type tricarboxylate transporter receptor subunit TctC